MNVAGEEKRRLAELRRQVETDPREAKNSVLAFLRDDALEEETPARESLHVRGVMALKALRTGTTELESLRGMLTGLLDEAEEQISARPESTAQMVRQRLKARRELEGRQIDRRTALRCKGLGKKYVDFELSGVDLDLKLGEITGVVGENANGKTTLFRLLVGETLPSSGEITFPELNQADPTRVDWAAVDMGLAYVPQSLKPWPGSLEENLRFAAASRGILGRGNDRAFDYIVERLNLRDQLGKPWSILSGGFRLRFELARALIWSPKVLVLDEPLANLDFRGQWTVLRDIRRLSRSFTDPIAVIISSQHLHEIEALADNILLLSGGQVAFNGPRELIGADRTENAFEVICEGPLQPGLERNVGSAIHSIIFDGMSYVVVTDIAFGAPDMLKAMLDLGVSPRYFRDISRSVKRLFEASHMSVP